MTQVLALDWDGSEVRCLLAAPARRKPRLLWAVSAPLSAGERDETVNADVGAALRAALADYRAGRATTVVGLDRASVEVFNWTLPPATDAELPLLVQNQVTRESASLQDDGIWDFVAPGDDPAGPRQVTAAVLSAERRKGIEQTCAAAGLKPTRIVLRPLAATSFFLKTVRAAERLCLLVNVLAEEVDLTVIAAGRASLMRTVRVPRDVAEEDAAGRLATEIGRTLVVAQQGTGNQAERIYLFGGPGEHQVLAERLEADLRVAVTVLDPFDGTDASRVELPAGAGRFASLLGMVLDEADRSHGIDFLHPKRPPRRVGRRRALVAGAAALLLASVAGGYLYWEAIVAHAAENRELARQRKEFDDAAKRGRKQVQLWRAVRDWNRAEIVWLDELRELSLRLPTSRDLLVQRMTISSGRSGGGSIDIQAIARDAGVIARIDRDLRDDYHTVSSRRVGDYPQGSDYTWLFERTIAVAPRHKSLYRSDEQPETPP